MRTSSSDGINHCQKRFKYQEVLTGVYPIQYSHEHLRSLKSEVCLCIISVMCAISIDVMQSEFKVILNNYRNGLDTLI